MEKKLLLHILATTNLILHYIDLPQIKHDNSLTKNARDLKASEMIDVIEMNLSFDGIEEYTVLSNFPQQLQTKEKAYLFMTLMMNRLSEKGIAGVVLPDGFLFGEVVKIKIKERLLSEFNLHKIVKMTKGVFVQYTEINRNILFFEKGKATEEVWYFEHSLPEEYVSKIENLQL